MWPFDDPAGLEYSQYDEQREHDAGSAAINGERAGVDEGGEDLAEEAERRERPLEERDVLTGSGQVLLRGATGQRRQQQAL